MKVLRSDRRVLSAVVNVIESLEPRKLLSAVVLTQIPTQSLAVSNTPTLLTLGTYFKDSSLTAGDTIIDIQTNLPAPDNSIPLELTDSATPITVANFLKYISNGEYANTIIHRSIPGFIFQGGGYTTGGTQIAASGPITGESSKATLKNTAGTIAMALSTGPNSGTTEWFFNLATNSQLDNTSDGGPFTAFGDVIYNGLTVLKDIAALPTVNDSQNGAWTNLPLHNYNGASGAVVSSVPTSELITTRPVVVPGGLTYSVTSTNSAVISGTVTNGSLALSSHSAGTANIIVTATDLNGGVATSTFTATTSGVAPLAQVSIANASAVAGTGSPIAFPVTLSTASSSDVTLSYTTTARTAPAGDYQTTGATLTIPAGTTTASIPVQVIADTLGTSESFTLTLSGLSSNVVFANGNTTESATGTIEPAGTTTTATVTTLTAAAPTVPNGGTDTFIATVAPGDAGTAAGTVTFSVDGVVTGIAAVRKDVAMLTVPLGVIGNDAVVATYHGSSTYTESTSNTLEVGVTSLTPAVAKSTLPAQFVVGNTARGTVLVTTANDTAATMTGFATIKVYASSNGLIDGNSILLATITSKKINLKPGRSITAAVPISSLPAALAAGNYTLLAQTIDPSSRTSNAAAGPALAVVAPTVSLSEDFVNLTPPASVITGSPTSLVAHLRITNNGNITSSGKTIITLYASTDGTLANGTAFKTVTPNLSIRPGKSIVVAVPLGAYPSVADGDYFITAQVTDPLAGTSSNDLSVPVNIAVKKIDLANTLVALPATGKVGKSVIVELNVANNGNITAAGKLQISFAASIVGSGSNPVALETLTTGINLKPNHTRTLRLRVLLKSGTPTGQVYLVSVVDPANVFADVHLSNNTSTSSSFIRVT